MSALEAAGYEVETYNIDAPPANGGSPNPVVRPQIKYPTYLGVLSHFDAVNYYSGDDFAPQAATETNPRRMTSRDRVRPARRRWRRWAHNVMLELRDYANEGGKLIVDGRNVHQPFTGTNANLGDDRPVVRGRRTSCSASTTRTATRATTICRARPGSARARSPTTRGRTTSASSAASRAPA